ncbi:hypothetical protein OIE66_12280 [Nonomuraea sp. NBC_01738]|uniref:hypothetical protein n=1 Tax=Nonomuraea sp. NBC_01738 TaxID=2976003 RepID=UPI002E0EFBA9|nr:hypothetical protein OIE66_12280 [Nonomuraea sp. NBC_01738]
MTWMTAWFAKSAQHTHLEFIPDPGAQPLVPREGYLRAWLAEGFLRQRTSWAHDQYPALHGGVTLDFLGRREPVAFTAVTTPSWSTPGVHLDHPITPLLPYNGGIVRLEAALFQVSQQGPLGAAVQVLGKLAGLMGPPLSAAATLASKMSDGLDAVLEATGDQPVLGLHWSMVAPGGNGQHVLPGHLVILDAPQPPGALTIEGGRLRAGGQPVELDYLVVRVECRAERDDPLTPELHDLVQRAKEHALLGNLDSMADLRRQAIILAWNSKDLVPADGRRVAEMLAREIDQARLGAAPGAEPPMRPLRRDDPELKGLRLADLLR